MTNYIHNLGAWHVSAYLGTGQGLVVSEATGDSIAVTYDEAHAPLVAAAPELLAALEAVLEYLEDSPRDYRLQTFGAVWRNTHAAIAKATGGEGTT